MKCVDGVNNGATTSVSEKVVTALLNNLLDTAMDKVMAKTVHGVEKRGNFVQKKEMESGEKNEEGGKEKLGKVKAPVSKTSTPAWVLDPKLPPGWKTCVTGRSALNWYNFQDSGFDNSPFQSPENLLSITPLVATFSPIGLRLFQMHICTFFNCTPLCRDIWLPD